MEYMFEPFTNPTKGKSPIAVGNVTARSGVELFIINRHCSKKDAVSTIIPRNTQVYIYDIGGGTAYVSYKGTIYGRCAVEDLDITYYTTW